MLRMERGGGNRLVTRARVRVGDGLVIGGGVLRLCIWHAGASHIGVGSVQCRAVAG